MTSTLSPQKELFDLNYQGKTSQLHLHLQVSRNSLFAAYFDSIKNQYLSLKTYSFGVSKTWDLAVPSIKTAIEGFQKNQPKTAHLSFTDTLFTLVPSSLFDEKQIDTYLKFNHSQNDFSSYQLTYNRLLNEEVVIAAAIPKSILQLFKSAFSDLKYYHFGWPLLEAFLIDQKEATCLSLHIQESRFDVVYKKGGKLYFFNSFDYQSVEDLLYFLLYVMEQLKIDREKIPVIVYGEFEKNTNLYEMLHRYIREIKIGERPKQAAFSQVLSTIPSQYYHVLFNQHLCE
tara:strand:- start:145 stop:1002 length:858 start_codon:yes stop_codon:yes gene_type:complete